MNNIFVRVALNGLICLFLLLHAALASAVEGGRASGQFDSNGIRLNVRDAYAFRGTPYLGGKEKVIIVVVSNQGFVQSAIDEYWDRRNALEKYFRDDKTRLVYFEFGVNGKYRGLSYYFEPGNGCGYCSDPLVQATAEIKNGRLMGQLKFPKGNDPNRWFDLTIDVPISTDDHGAPQGPGGGEAGKAYLAYHRALTGKNEQAIRALLSEERRKVWTDAAAKGKGAQFLAFLREEHPHDVRVTEAYIKGAQALVLFEGRGSVGSIRGEALFSLEKGAWRFEEETIQLVVN